MKNAFLAVTFLLVISSSFATQTATESKLAEIAATQFGKTILETIAVEIESKANPVPTIVQLLEDLRAEILAAQLADDQADAQRRETCSNLDSSLTGEISGLGDAIDESNNHITSLTEERASIQGQRDALDQARTGFQNELDAATTSRNANQELWEQKDAYYNRVLDVLRQVRLFISQRLDTRRNPTFLQTNTQSFMTALSQIREHAQSEEFMKISPGYGHLVSFLAAKIENTLKQDEDEIAEAGLNSILTVIDRLIASFQENQLADKTANDADAAAFEETQTRLNGLITQHTLDIANLDSQLATIDASLNTENGLVETNTALQNTKQGELDANSAACTTGDEDYAARSADRSDQLEVIDAVLKILHEDLSSLERWVQDF